MAALPLPRQVATEPNARLLFEAEAPPVGDRPPFRSRFLQLVQRWFERQSIRNELVRLTDRELADIGLERSDIEKVLRPGYRR
jgi:uncharacterized protein YjiS (DUF1127 family)